MDENTKRTLEQVGVSTETFELGFTVDGRVWRLECKRPSFSQMERYYTNRGTKSLLAAALSLIRDCTVQPAWAVLSGLFDQKPVIAIDIVGLLLDEVGANVKVERLDPTLSPSKQSAATPTPSAAS